MPTSRWTARSGWSFRTDRLRNERCSPALLLDPNSGCRGGFKAPRLDNQVNLRSSGIIGRRVHLNVDYDSERDFTANNDVQVYYEGLEDEIVRRIEVGTVQFQPPPSRFITAAVPANNFGVNASFEVGPVQVQTLAATQKGSQVAERVYTDRPDHQPAAGQQVRDLDFETGRFFWVVDPAGLPGYPAIDILNLDPGVVPAGDRPQQVRVYRYRASAEPVAPQSQPRRHHGARPQRRWRSDCGPVRWELLIQGTDYYLDRLRALARARHQAGPERLPGGQLHQPPTAPGRQLPGAGSAHGSTDSLRSDRGAAAGPRPWSPSATRCGRSTGWPARISTRLAARCGSR